ncbi:hypothetical protein AGLY_007770 [Aphis glycines]|uniref:Uncharacterized protein n=1 Tax=Aphis glycines TaxID=307491 RepID=A0A6G0TN12_APHGL|nr:hypothetical protein AGLY_007770 [Aphis glycines]
MYIVNRTQRCRDTNLGYGVLLLQLRYEKYSSRVLQQLVNTRPETGIIVITDGLSVTCLRITHYVACAVLNNASCRQQLTVVYIGTPTLRRFWNYFFLSGIYCFQCYIIDSNTVKLHKSSLRSANTNELYLHVFQYRAISVSLGYLIIIIKINYLCTILFISTHTKINTIRLAFTTRIYVNILSSIIV